MAKRLNVRESLSPIQDAPAQDTPTPAAAPPADAPNGSQTPELAAEGSADTPAPERPTRPRSARRTAATGTRRKRAAPPAAQPPQLEPAEEEGNAATPAAAGAPSRPEALVPSRQSDAKALPLYLHQEDWRMLQLAKVQDDVDHQARFRAMLALYRSNARFRASVDQIGKRQPKLQGRRYGGRA